MSSKSEPNNTAPAEPAAGAAADAPPTAAAPDAPKPRPRKAAARKADELPADEDQEAKAANPKRPHRPSFGMSEGTREELERTGRATDPFTGEEYRDEARLAELRDEARRRGESVPREA